MRVVSFWISRPFDSPAQALLDLASTCKDEEIITNCAAALNNLIPYGDYYPPWKLCDLGVVPVIVKLVKSDDARVRHFMALCLC